jgi:hypothetical protein
MKDMIGVLGQGFSHSGYGSVLEEADAYSRRASIQGIETLLLFLKVELVQAPWTGPDGENP